jgi:hypothetical protein
MATQNRTERVRRAVEDAARRLEQQTRRPPDRPSGPAPGDLYVFATGVDAMVEWLVVRPHPDDPALLLLAPADDFPMAGRADVPLEPEFADRPLTVRCGEAVWVPASACREHLRVGAVPDDGVALVRRKLAALARGELPEQAGGSRCEEDPEYAAWLGLIARSREVIEQRADSGAVVEAGTLIPFERFTTQLPPALAAEPQSALAANPGGELMVALAESLASASLRFLEVPLASGGTLLLTADEGGVRVAWNGPEGSGPPPISAPGPSGRVVGRWRAGTQVGIHRGEPIFPWSDGQVTLVVGGDAPETLTVRL